MVVVLRMVRLVTPPLSRSASTVRLESQAQVSTKPVAAARAFAFGLKHGTEIAAPRRYGRRAGRSLSRGCAAALACQLPAG